MPIGLHKKLIQGGGAGGGGGDGSSSASAASSAMALRARGINTDGAYWITIPNVGTRQI